MLDIDALIQEIKQQRQRQCFAASGALIGYLDALGFVVLDQADDIVVYKPSEEVATKEKTLDELLADRLEAKKCKDWQQADAIRKLIESKGFAIADQKDGSCRLVPLPQR